MMPTIITIITALITICLIIWLIKAQKLITKVSLSFIIGGAVGNIIDRVEYGAVIDFLDFRAFGLHWPFNIMTRQSQWVLVSFYENFVLKDMKHRISGR